MPGIYEILILAAMLFGFFLYPRMTGARRPAARFNSSPRPSSQHLSGPARLAIAASLFWTAAAAIYFQPWETGKISFLAYGVGPVALLWGGKWVRAGFREKKR